MTPPSPSILSRRGAANTLYALALTLALTLALSLATTAIPAPSALAPPAPDYSQLQSWAVWPGRPGEADVVPPGVVDQEANQSGSVDVFFVHPTTYMSDSQANARFDEPGMTSVLIEHGVLRSQVSAFNHCCRIYAPHYRQAALATFFHDDGLDSVALNLAYGDVLKAFDYYLANANHGRPFIIAGHSQGSLHVLRLLQERIAGTALQQQLIAAYVVGYFVPQDIERTGLSICRSSTQTGCIVSWNTIKPSAAQRDSRSTHLLWLEGRYQRLGGLSVVCVNPLTWTMDADAPASSNIGALPGVQASEPLRAVVPALTGANCHSGELTVAIPFRSRHGFSDALTMFGSYHIYDYNLFYSNIRANAGQRTRAFLDRHHNS